MTARPSGSQQLVLLGAWHAHVQVLVQLAEQPLPGVQITLVSPYPRQMYSGMVPGFIAGHYTLEDCVIPLEPLVRRSGVRWLQTSAVALDAEQQSIALADGSTLHYDWLSVNTGPVQDRDRAEQALPGSREHGLFVRPIEHFTSLWPKVAQMGRKQALRIAVIGAGAGGIELAFALRHRMPQAAVNLLSGSAPPGANYPMAVQRRLQLALTQRGITIVQEAATSIDAEAVYLRSGAALPCNVALLATGTNAPAWLVSSGLALDESGFIAVDEYQRSTSHQWVFAAGDVSTRMDQTLARSGVYAVRAGPALAYNLAAATRGSALQPHKPPQATLNLIACGDPFAIGTWGRFSAQGRWVWWLKDWIDRRFMARLR